MCVAFGVGGKSGSPLPSRHPRGLCSGTPRRGAVRAGGGGGGVSPSAPGAAGGGGHGTAGAAHHPVPRTPPASRRLSPAAGQPHSSHAAPRGAGRVGTHTQNSLTPSPRGGLWGDDGGSPRTRPTRRGSSGGSRPKGGGSAGVPSRQPKPPPRRGERSRAAFPARSREVPALPVTLSWECGLWEGESGQIGSLPRLSPAAPPCPHPTAPGNAAAPLTCCPLPRVFTPELPNSPKFP